MAIGVSISTMVSAGLVSFTAPFLLRSSFGLDLKQVAMIVAGLTGGAALVGTVAGGAVCDRFARNDVRLYLRLPACAYFLAGPLYAAAFVQETLTGFIVLSALAQMSALFYLGPTFGVLHNMVEPRMRATAVAIVFVMTSIIGLGLGPMLVGGISDIAAASVASTAASFEGLRIALVLAALVYLWAGLHYFLASRTLPRALTSDLSTKH
jgi:MFS family permease